MEGQTELEDAQSPTMASTDAKSQEPLLHDPTESSNKLEQEAAPESPLHRGSERPYRDFTFTFLFLTAILTTFTFGIIASTRTDTLNMDTKLRLSSYNPTTNKCEITQQEAPKASDSDRNSDSAFVILVALASLSALALTIPPSLWLVSLLRRSTHTLAVMSAPLISLLLLVLGLLGGLLWFSGCLSVPEVWSVVLGNKEISDAVYALISWGSVYGFLLWDMIGSADVENEVEVMRIATGFLKEHLVLLVVNPVLLAGALIVVNRPIFTFMWYALRVREIVPNFDVVNDPIKGCGLATGIPCCRQESPGWVNAYFTFASFTVFWVLMVSMVLQHSVVNGTVSLWYFSQKGSSAIGNIKRSLRNAYGPSFGTACNLGTIVTTLNGTMVRFFKEKLSDKLLESNSQGMMSNILQGCFSWMSPFPEHYPQLPSIFLGISESSKKSHPNLLQQTSPVSTGMSNFRNLGIHAAWGIFVTCTLAQIFSVNLELDYSNASVLIAVAYCFPIIVIALATGFALTVFSVIKSVSVLYALERDAGEISNARQRFWQESMITAPSSPENENGAQVAER